MTIETRWLSEAGRDGSGYLTLSDGLGSRSVSGEVKLLGRRKRRRLASRPDLLVERGNAWSIVTGVDNEGCRYTGVGPGGDESADLDCDAGGEWMLCDSELLVC